MANCGACALTAAWQDSPNYAAWPLAYMENRRAIPAKWREAFKAELASDNKLYTDNVRATMERLGVRFTDGHGLDLPELYDALVAAGCEIDNHESDLYVRATPQARATGAA